MNRLRRIRIPFRLPGRRRSSGGRAAFSPVSPPASLALADDGLILPVGVWTFVAAQLALVAFVFLLVVEARPHEG